MSTLNKILYLMESTQINPSYKASSLNRLVAHVSGYVSNNPLWHTHPYQWQSSTSSGISFALANPEGKQTHHINFQCVKAPCYRFRYPANLNKTWRNAAAPNLQTFCKTTKCLQTVNRWTSAVNMDKLSALDSRIQAKLASSRAEILACSSPFIDDFCWSLQVISSSSSVFQLATCIL